MHTCTSLYPAFVLPTMPPPPPHLFFGRAGGQCSSCRFWKFSFLFGSDRNIVRFFNHLGLRCLLPSCHLQVARLKEIDIYYVDFDARLETRYKVGKKGTEKIEEAKLCRLSTKVFRPNVVGVPLHCAVVRLGMLYTRAQRGQEDVRAWEGEGERSIWLFGV